MTEFLATCWTSAGDVRPGRTPDESPVPFVDRVKSVAAAGFTGIGLELADLEVVRRSIGFAQARSIADDHGLVHVEVEFLNDWWIEGDRRRTSDDRRERLLDAAAVLGAHHVKLGTGEPGDTNDPDRLATALEELAGAASRAGTRLAIETGAGSALDLADDVLPAVRQVAHPALGVMLDPWHFVRSGTPYSLIDSIAAPEIVAVEVSDGAAEPVGTLFDDTFDRRLLPGTGDFDVAEFAAAVLRTGWTGVWGVEIMSDAFRALPSPVLLSRAFSAAEAVVGPAVDAYQRGVSDS